MTLPQIPSLPQIDTTNMPLLRMIFGAMISLLPTIIGFVVYLSHLDAEVKRLEEVTMQQDKRIGDLNIAMRPIPVIEERLKVVEVLNERQDGRINSMDQGFVGLGSRLLLAEERQNNIINLIGENRESLRVGINILNRIEQRLTGQPTQTPPPLVPLPQPRPSAAPGADTPNGPTP